MWGRLEPPPSLPVCPRPRREAHIVDTHDDSRGGAAPADLLHGDGVGQVIEAGSAELLGHVHGHKPQLAHLLHLAPGKDVTARAAPGGAGWGWGHRAQPLQPQPPCPQAGACRNSGRVTLTPTPEPPRPDLYDSPVVSGSPAPVLCPHSSLCLQPRPVSTQKAQGFGGLRGEGAGQHSATQTFFSP